MVSTRQMTIGNNGNEGNQLPNEHGPAKFTRNSTIQTIGTVQLSRPVQSTHLLDMPEEVIEKILSYLPFKTICQLRLVCRTVDRICGHMLNSSFSKLQTQMLQRFQDIKSKMPRRESARRSHYLASESDIIETLHMRLTLLQMAFGKHIERRHCFFFPGEILDEVYRILHYIKVTVKLDLPYKVTDELFDLSTMAMEYFKDKIEPNLPEIAYFSPEFLTFPTGTSTKLLHMDSTNLVSDISKDSVVSDHDAIDVEDDDLVDPIPQSNMVLRKRIRKIKQGMKRYNSQLSDLRQVLKSCKRKTAEQQKQIADQQKQLADQQKQTLEYATRLDEYDKKNDEISRKFSTLLQELNKCKTELQYWRCKSPAASFCTACGNAINPHPEDLQVLLNQGVHPDGLSVEPSDLNSGLNVNVTPGTDQKVNNRGNDKIEESVACEEDATSSTPITINGHIILKVEPELQPSVSPICIRNVKRNSSTDEQPSTTAGTPPKKKRRPSKIRKVKSKA